MPHLILRLLCCTCFAPLKARCWSCITNLLFLKLLNNYCFITGFHGEGASVCFLHDAVWCLIKPSASNKYKKILSFYSGLDASKGILYSKMKRQLKWKSSGSSGKWSRSKIKLEFFFFIMHSGDCVFINKAAHYLCVKRQEKES